MIINFNLFPGPTALLRGPTFNKFIIKHWKKMGFVLQRPQNFAKFSMPYFYSRPVLHCKCFDHKNY
jgi:hypothetical protein